MQQAALHLSSERRQYKGPCTTTRDLWGQNLRNFGSETHLPWAKAEFTMSLDAKALTCEGVNKVVVATPAPKVDSCGIFLDELNYLVNIRRR